LSAPRTGGKGRRRGEADRRRASGGRRGQGGGAGVWRLETALTGGPHLSAVCESERGVAGWLVVGGPAAVFGPRGKRKKNMLG
jgi:hypothetical protein